MLPVDYLFNDVSSTYSVILMHVAKLTRKSRRQTGLHHSGTQKTETLTRENGHFSFQGERRIPRNEHRKLLLLLHYFTMMLYVQVVTYFFSSR